MSFENTFETFGSIDRLDTLRQFIPQIIRGRWSEKLPASTDNTLFGSRIAAIIMKILSELLTWNRVMMLSKYVRCTLGPDAIKCTNFILKMVQSEYSWYDLCSKCLRIWYHIKADWLLFLLLFKSYHLLL